MHYMVQAFFNGSTERAVAALLDLNGNGFSDDDFDRLTGLIEQAKKQGR